MSEGKKYCPRCGYEMVEVTAGEPICTNCGYAGTGVPFKNPLEPAPDPLALLKRCKEVLKASSKDCLNCPNQGWYVNGLTDEPEQVQCEFCYTVPNSTFNINALLSDIAKAEEGEMITFQPGDRVVYTPTGEKGIVRSSAGPGLYFVVYDLTDEQATLESDWSAKSTPANMLRIIYKE